MNHFDWRAVLEGAFLAALDLLCVKSVVDGSHGGVVVIVITSFEVE